MDKDRREKANTTAVIGAGSWGTTIARVIAENHRSHGVRLWAYEPSVVKSIIKSRINREFLPGITLPDNIIPTNSLRDCVSGAAAVIIASPSKSVVDVCGKIRKHLVPGTPVGFLSKGFCRHHQDILTISEAITAAIPFLGDRVVAISGPSHAEEVSRNYHTCLCVGGKSREARRVFTRLLNNDYLECRETDDIRGVELGGTLKNPAAIAAGMISAIENCGDNLAGALMAEAMKEILRIGRSMGAREETLIDICGCGDLVATSLSGHSRNRRFGMDIARQLLSTGRSIGFLDRILLRFKPEKVLARMTEKRHYLAEGAYAIEPLIEIAESNNISIPVYRSLYEVLLNRKDPLLLIETIKNPDRFEELYRSSKMHTGQRKRGMEKTVGSVFSGVIAREMAKRYKNDISFKNEIVSFAERKFDQTDGLSAAPGPPPVFSDPYEMKMIKRLMRDGSPEIVEKLSAHYMNGLSDRYSFIFFRFLGTLYSVLRLLGFNLLNSGEARFVVEKDKQLLRELRNLGKRSNTVFLVRREYADVWFPLVTAINGMGLPLPRFMAVENGMGLLKKLVLSLSGGFRVSAERMVNPLYRETVMSYLSNYIKHGIPLLYFMNGDGTALENGLDEDWIFINMTLNRIKKSTEEITLVPVNISRKLINDKDEKAFNLILSISPPLLLSDYADGREKEIELRERIYEAMGGSAR